MDIVSIIWKAKKGTLPMRMNVPLIPFFKDCFFFFGDVACSQAMLFYSLTMYKAVTKKYN